MSWGFYDSIKVFPHWKWMQRKLAASKSVDSIHKHLHLRHFNNLFGASAKKCLINKSVRNFRSTKSKCQSFPLSSTMGLGDLPLFFFFASLIFAQIWHFIVDPAVKCNGFHISDHIWSSEKKLFTRIFPVEKCYFWWFEHPGHVFVNCQQVLNSKWGDDCQQKHFNPKSLSAPLPLKVMPLKLKTWYST